MKIFLLSFIITVTGCTNQQYAPVTMAHISKEKKYNEHVVQKGETLYSIAVKYNKDYNDLAGINLIEKPYTIFKGQRIKINATNAEKNLKPKLIATNLSNKTIDKNTVTKKKISNAKTKARTNAKTVNKWVWPATGNIIRSFSELTNNKGIDIEGKLGDPVFAAYGGEVVYSGDDVDGYGNLLIIKHTEELLTAYSNNNEVLVKVGDVVSEGQLVSKMGSKNNMSFLHFEIRKFGKPVDPVLYLRS